jgi:carboxyl-terminal processing protease
MARRHDGTRRSGAVPRAPLIPIIALVPFVLGLAACAAPAGTPTPTPPPPLTEPEALAVFDFAWARVHETYYDTTFRGLDWGAVRDELRPQAAATRSTVELRALIDGMLARLGDSHFGVIPGDRADALDPEAVAGAPGEPGTVGLELRVVEDRMVVFRAAPAGVGAAAGVEPGWVVESIDTLASEWLLGVLDEVPDRRLAEARVAWAAESRLAGRVGDTVRASFRDSAGRLHEVVLGPDPMVGTPVRFGNLPTMFSHVEHAEVPVPGGCAGLIRFNVWMTTILPDLEAAFLALRHCDGLVLDLRGNPGGVAGMVMGVSGYFMTESKPLGVMTTRQGQLRLVSMPRRVTADGRPTTPYTGPLALMVDGQSMSTSEIFAAGLQGVGHACVFGEPSGGQALPALMARMPNNDVLMYVFADFLGPDGTRIEGRGVIPDVVVPLARADLVAGRDAPLDAALGWIEGRIGTDPPVSTSGSAVTMTSNGGC